MNILETNKNITGEIYIITNIENNMIYVGQTRSHYKNRGKYRPFGYVKRFNSHISEALVNNKKKQCTYLNNAIRKYGKDKFTVKLLELVSLDELDTKEKYYIEKFSSTYPSGYNLTSGGKTKQIYKIKNNSTESIKMPKKHNTITKELISKQLLAYNNTNSAKEIKIKNAIEQHYNRKLNRYINCVVDINNIESYIHPVINKKNNNISYYCIKINNIKSKFVDKDPILSKERAIKFINHIHMRHNQIDGKIS